MNLAWLSTLECQVFTFTQKTAVPAAARICTTSCQAVSFHSDKDYIFTPFVFVIVFAFSFVSHVSSCIISLWPRLKRQEFWLKCNWQTVHWNSSRSTWIDNGSTWGLPSYFAVQNKQNFKERSVEQFSILGGKICLTGSLGGPQLYSQSPRKKRFCCKDIEQICYELAGNMPSEKEEKYNDTN